MKTITSADFRKTYQRLEEPTLVTANGHPIGTWATLLNYSREELEECVRRLVEFARTLDRPYTVQERDAIFSSVGNPVHAIPLTDPPHGD